MTKDDKNTKYPVIVLGRSKVLNKINQYTA